MSLPETAGSVALVEAHEEIFFSRDNGGELRQWVSVTLDNPHAQPIPAQVTITAAGLSARTELSVAPGAAAYRCFAPVLWPDHAPNPTAIVTLVAGDLRAEIATTVGTHRPWTVYLLSDICTDYTWVYDQEELPRAHDAAVTKAELELAESTANAPDALRNRYNFVHARLAEFFLENYPEDEARFFDAVRAGVFTFNPFFNMALTGSMSLEELIRQFYPARRWATAHGLEIGYANHQETPTITWAMATVLAGCGINHLVKSILPYECPWAARLEEPPIYRWEGPDGSRVLVRRRNTNYVEGNFVLRDLRATNLALHDLILPENARLGDAYPYAAIGLVGCYGDLAPESARLPARKTATVAAYAEQGWEYPKLVNANHIQFWDDINAQIQAQQIDVPVYRGDYGSAWEAWPSSLAYDYAGWRRAQERAGTADKLAAILARLAPHTYAAISEWLAQGWINVTYLADHAWNGANDANRRLNADLRRRWHETANRAFDQVIGAGLAALARQADLHQGVLVFNGLGWSRTGLVRLPDEIDAAGLVDAETGEEVPVQLIHEQEQPVRYALARDVPSVGYRTYRVAAQGQSDAVAALPFQSGPDWLEGPFYRLELDPVTGAVARLVDKTRGRDLVDAASPYGLNQAVYVCGGQSVTTATVEYAPRAESVSIEADGPIFGRVVVQSRLKNLRITTTITLYAHLDRVDFHNDVEKTPVDEREELFFAFPFHVPDRQYRFEAPGAIITPGEEQLPGAGQAITAVRHFVDLFNAEAGVTLSMADSGLVEFGGRTSLDDPQAPNPANATVFALALGNWINWREVTHDQAGQTRFTFRYSVGGHGGGFDPVAALRFGWEDNNELLAVAMPGEGSEGLPAVHSFVSVEPAHALLTCLKAGEEEGLIARVWECAGAETAARLHVSGLGSLTTALSTDLLERDQEALSAGQDEVVVPIRGRGISACRLRFA